MRGSVLECGVRERRFRRVEDTQPPEQAGLVNTLYSRNRFFSSGVGIMQESWRPNHW